MLSRLPIILAKCPWLVLLLPPERHQAFLLAAIDAVPAIATLVIEKLNAAQRLRALKQSPQLIAKLGHKLTAVEYRKLVLIHPQLAVHYQDWANSITFSASTCRMT